MRYFEVLLADSRYHGDAPLTYSHADELAELTVVTVPLKQRMVTGFVIKKVGKPAFTTKPIKSILSSSTLPKVNFELAYWIQSHYACNLGDALRLLAPSTASIRPSAEPIINDRLNVQLEFNQPLTDDQSQAIDAIKAYGGTSVLLHGDTGTGKTRVYLELAKDVIEAGRSVVVLTPEIALTTQLATVFHKNLQAPIFILHSQLTVAQRKKIWLSILNSKQPAVIIGPRSALFSPVQYLGLIIIDEAHEPSYKQEQSPRYHASRVASQLGRLSRAKVILGTATPLLSDYYLASQHQAVVRMKTPAVGTKHTEFNASVVDLRQRKNFGSNPYLSNQLIAAIKDTLSAKKQVLIYLNRRGTARLILCVSCGWQLQCPNCDIPLVYHGDEFIVRCHSCGHSQKPPTACPQCHNLDVIYKNIGTKSLAEELRKLFPDHNLQRFDSDNVIGQRVNEVYAKLQSGEIDILVGTQLLAKGFDLPKLGLVGIIAADSSMALPDFSAEERTFQLLYQVIGRVGRGHGAGRVIVQTYNPSSPVLQAAVTRSWEDFYEYGLKERQKYRFPPFSYMLQLVIKRVNSKSAQAAADKLKAQLIMQKLPVEIIGPTPKFFGRRGRYYYWQIIAKSKNRKFLLQLIKDIPSEWAANLDPIDLL